MDGVFATLAVNLADDGLRVLVFGAVVIGLLIAVAFLLSGPNQSVYDQIGAGGLSREGEHGAPAAPDPATDAAEREQEVRQMLSARNERLLRAGRPPLDLDAELARLLAPSGERAEDDPELLEEVRQLVNARNERRLRAGLEPLDVEAEVARTLDELGT